MTAAFCDAVEQWCCVASQCLGWPPHDFWQATPVELVTALRDPISEAAATGPSRQHIAQMMERDEHG